MNNKRSGRFKDLTGETFGMLTVIEEDIEQTNISKERRRNGEITTSKLYWKCKCECGNEVTKDTTYLKKLYYQIADVKRQKYTVNQIENIINMR